MSKDLIFKKCTECGAIVKVLEDCNCNGCGIICCGKPMASLVPNSVDAAVEKHVPTYEVDGEYIKVKVNHVMENEHYIEWIALVSDKKECINYFNPGDNLECCFKYIKGSTLYAYCNKHGLWKKDVE